ncbi:uncharacterized protein LOC132602662 [Lycium barbarum]|uniref:uncharacterized protein LOC132602662 n=1 Tax=Lycium barbarum TaxID=112863 RepID=UPI00293F7465|nr:uncharacterized protein LOC132602662 [Lycium barbarum]
MRDIFIFKQFESLYICDLTSSKKIHSVNMASKLSFFFCILLVSLAVDSFWSSNTQVMALRDLPLLEEAVQVIKQIAITKVDRVHNVGSNMASDPSLPHAKFGKIDRSI